jgi:formylglycine-generating enzyme required for sulfatase activity
MPQPPAKQFLGIFICYRRRDAAGHAGWLTSMLVDHFGRDRIFMDIDTIEPGDEFPKVIEIALRSCEIMITIIGQHWLSGSNDRSRWLDDPDDFVRLEIAAALTRDIRVIPVLVHGATMPKPQDLPPDLANLSHRNAVKLDDQRWHYDVAQLIKVLDKEFAKREALSLAKQKEESQQKAKREEELRLAKQEKERQQEAEQEEALRLAKQEKERQQEAEREEALRLAKQEKERQQEAEREEALRLAKQEKERQQEAEQEEALRLAKQEKERQQEAEQEEALRLAKQEKAATNSPTGVLATGGLPDTRLAVGKNVPMVMGGLVAIVVVGAIILSTQMSRIRAFWSPVPEPTPSTASKPIDPNVPSPVDIEMVSIPPGYFDMGSANGHADEKPVLHHVTISKPFFIGKYEVTQAQWEKVMGYNHSSFKDCGGDCPVEQVSWNEVKRFINKLNESNEGYTYRLPTEAEWEYACRAKTTGDYAGQLSEMAWYSGNSNRTHSIRERRQPNAWGLVNMHGNVAEWCEDLYEDNYRNAPTDGSASQRGDGAKRVLRGGSWNGAPDALRSASRGRAAPGNHTERDGFRLVAVRITNK